MNTAMQELIEQINKGRDILSAQSENYPRVKTQDVIAIIESYINHATELLEKEKQQITDAYEQGEKDSIMEEKTGEREFAFSSHYFSQTYNQ